MKAVILAAGLGSRLHPVDAHHLPKPLTELANGKSILQLQLDNLASFISLDDVFIVVGYRKEAILDAFPDLTYIYNPHFSQENTSKSLWRALRKIEDDVLWMNGDVVFHPRVLEQVFQAQRTGMVVNSAVVGEEEVKYRADTHGHILEVSKQMSNPQGEALGINFFTKEDLPVLKKNLELCQRSDYFEKAIEMGIQHQHQVVWKIPVEAADCVEIDFPEDLEKANRFFD